MNRPIRIRPPEPSAPPPVENNPELDALRVIVAGRGRRLRLVEMPDTGGRARPPTMWLSSTVEDIVLVNPEEPAEHREHALVQDLAQLLSDRNGSTNWLDVSQLLPDLDPAVIERVIAG